MDTRRMPDLDRSEAPERQPARPVAQPGGGSLAAFASAMGNQGMGAFLARREVNGAEVPPAGARQATRGFDLQASTDEEKLKEIETRLNEGYFRLAEIWLSFADLPAVANANGDLWKRSVAKAPTLAADDAVREAFKQKVEGIAVGHLEQNRALVVAEIEALGITPNVGGTGGTVDESPDHIKEVAKLQALAADVARAMKAKDALQLVPVGWSSDHTDYDPMGAPYTPQVVRFDPARPPAFPPKPEDTGHRAWSQVAEQYKVVEAVLARGMAHPALFSLMTYDRGILGLGKDNASIVADFSATSTRGASVAITNHMRRLIEAIEGAARGIGGEIDYRDLKPVHDQVLKAPPFTQPFEESVAKQDVAGHESMKTLTTLGLTAVQIIALVGATMSGGALLPIVGAAAGGLQAGISIDEYQRLKTARDARTGNKEHDLVSQDQVDDAQVAAVLDTVFAFMDGIEAVSGLAKAARGGARTAEELLPELGRLGTLPAAKRETVLLEAMQSMGTGKAIEAAGGIEAVRGAGAAGKRAEAFSAEIESRLADQLAKRPKDAPAADLVPEAERYAAELTGVSRGKALDTIAPRLKDEARLQELVAKLKAKPYTAWDGLAPEARLAQIHDAAAAKHANSGMPIPTAKFDGDLHKGGAGSFSPGWWTISYSKSDFTGPVTYGDFIELTDTAAHEFRHAEQEFATMRYELATGTHPDDLEGNVDTVMAAIDEHKKRPMDLTSQEARDAKGWREELRTNQKRTNLVEGNAVRLWDLRKEAKEALAAAEFKAATLTQLKAQGKAAEELEAAAADTAAAYERWRGLDASANSSELVQAERDYFELGIERDAYARGNEAGAAELDKHMRVEFGPDYDKQVAALRSNMAIYVTWGLMAVVGGGAAATYYAVKRSPGAPAGPGDGASSGASGR